MKKEKRRKLQVAVISDIHLGTYGCKATELNKYLKSINPETLILNGDIIDIWQFNKRYFPKSHIKVIKQIMSLMTSNTKVYYVKGNHDEALRRFTGFTLGKLEITNKVILNIDGKKAWFFHGDVFDITMKNSKWLAKLGGIGYDFLIVLNTLANWISYKLGYGKLSFSKKIKNNIKSAIKFINDFETTASDIAIANNYDYVVCGHIHQPEIRKINTNKGETTYLNSGDWVENLTALEYHNNAWTLYEYDKDEHIEENQSNDHLNEIEEDLQSNSQILDDLLKEFNIKKFAK